MVNLLNNYFMDADDEQFILKRKVLRQRKTNEETYEAEELIGYYTTIENLVESCITHIIRDKIMNDELNTLLDCVNQLRSMKNDIKVMLKH